MVPRSRFPASEDYSSKNATRSVERVVPVLLTLLFGARFFTPCVPDTIPRYSLVREIRLGPMIYG